MTFWARLEDALTDKNLTVADLSRKVGVAPSVINSWKTKGSIPRADIACKTAEALDTTVEYLINGYLVDGNTELSPRNTYLVPILNQFLSAGNGSLLPEEDTVKGLMSLPSYLKEYGDNLAGLYVHGVSMEPTLKNGDMVVCTSLGWDHNDGLYAIRYNGNGYVKRLQADKDKIIIISDNPSYKTIEEPVDSEYIHVIGKVVLIIKKP